MASFEKMNIILNECFGFRKMNFLNEYSRFSKNELSF